LKKIRVEWTRLGHRFDTIRSDSRASRCATPEIQNAYELHYRVARCGRQAVWRLPRVMFGPGARNTLGPKKRRFDQPPPAPGKEERRAGTTPVLPAHQATPGASRGCSCPRRVAESVPQPGFGAVNERGRFGRLGSLDGRGRLAESRAADPRAT